MVPYQPPKVCIKGQCLHDGWWYLDVHTIWYCDLPCVDACGVSEQVVWSVERPFSMIQASIHL